MDPRPVLITRTTGETTTSIPRRTGLIGLIGVAGIGAEWELDEIETGSEGWIGTDDEIAINEKDSERCLTKYELRDGPPPPLDTWDRAWSGSLRSISGKVRAVNEYSGDALYGAESDLGREGRVRQVRIHRNPLDHEDFTPDLICAALINMRFRLDH
ncbi:hypothetical protein [Streptosporangium sp. OZ121]|uniref:hypothetical protein n=1 Tax=Streptosporangium sp. OZ121 TaxID=3444183 RepID=UPI003F7AB533